MYRARATDSPFWDSPFWSSNRFSRQLKYIEWRIAVRNNFYTIDPLLDITPNIDLLELELIHARYQNNTHRIGSAITLRFKAEVAIAA